MMVAEFYGIQSGSSHSVEDIPKKTRTIHAASGRPMTAMPSLSILPEPRLDVPFCLIRSSRGYVTGGKTNSQEPTGRI